LLIEFFPTLPFSRHVCGLLARMSRLECARETIRLVLEALEAQEALPG
jgi:hypothetical protein